LIIFLLSLNENDFNQFGHQHIGNFSSNVCKAETSVIYILQFCCKLDSTTVVKRN
jgi:hypothetical protein